MNINRHFVSTCTQLAFVSVGSIALIPEPFNHSLIFFVPHGFQADRQFAIKFLKRLAGRLSHAVCCNFLLFQSIWFFSFNSGCTLT